MSDPTAATAEAPVAPEPQPAPQPRGWPQVNDTEPSVARWRQAVEERLEHVDEKLDALLARNPLIARLFERVVVMVERVSTSGGLKYVAGTTVALAAVPLVMAALLLTLAGTGWELQWGDLRFGAVPNGHSPAEAPAQEEP